MSRTSRHAPILLTVMPVYHFTCDWSPAGRFVDCNAAGRTLSRPSPNGRNRRTAIQFVWTRCPQSLRFCMTRLHSLLADGKERQPTAQRRRVSGGERRVFQRLLAQIRRLTLPRVELIQAFACSTSAYTGKAKSESFWPFSEEMEPAVNEWIRQFANWSAAISEMPFLSPEKVGS